MPLNENCILAVVNRMDTATVTAGSAVATFPAANLQRGDLSRPWRSAGVTPPVLTGRDVTAGRTWLEVDLGLGRPLQMISLIRHNLSQGATWRVRLASEATFAAPAYDSGEVKAWPRVSGFGSLDWGVFSWGDLFEPEEAALYDISSYLLLPVPVTARYLRIDLLDAGNAAGFLQVARAFAGPVWQPTLNMEMDWTVGFEDPSEEARALGGALTFDERPRFRVATFTLGHLPEPEALANILGYLDRHKGRTGDLIFIPQPAKPETFIHEAIYGRQRRLDALRSPYFDQRRTRGFEIEELR